MCGIIGYVGLKNCIPILIDGLSRLEYRGYDSSGIAYLDNNQFVIKKEQGKLEKLIEQIDFKTNSNIGIGHTRWATHGIADKINAHPHKVGKFTIVHNGIIENCDEIKKDLIKRGYKFESDTDTEVLCALINYLYCDNSIMEILSKLNLLIEGSYALGILCEDFKGTLFAIKKNSPLIIGIGENEKFIASDVPAILDKTKQYIVLEDGDYAEIKFNDVKVYCSGKEKDYKINTFEFDMNLIDKQGYEHYMLKEIYEQPEAFKKTIQSYLGDNVQNLITTFPNFSKYNTIRIVACGSAMHAGCVGRQLIEKFGNIKVEVNSASEFRYDKVFLHQDELVIVISQSGETADTLEAVRIANKYGIDTLGIVNEKGSSITREVKINLYTQAGKEIAVATTKAYFSQVTMLMLIALKLSIEKQIISEDEMFYIIKEINNLPNHMITMLNNIEYYKEVAEYIKNNNDIFYIGRGMDYALAMEGSLKLKEISYKHSEAYPAGELKHGTISLIDKGTPVIAIVTDDNVVSKTISNIKEVKSRGAYVIYVTDNCCKEDTSFYDKKILIPKVHSFLTPLLAIIPLQIIAYYVARLNGCNIDQPKNLAKSVTVE